MQKKYLIFPKITLSFIIIFISILNLNAQVDANKESIQSSYANYFNAERETIYLHFNKNTFLSNEAIWFKGYIFDKKNNIPFITTTNVHVILFDAAGNEIETKLFYAEKGTFSGSFNINKDYKTGSYFFKVYTNWMKNFKEDESYTSAPIQIINLQSSLDNNNSSQNETLDYDLQFLPESGHSITNTKNSIGFKVLNCEGDGLKINGVIENSKGEIITNFKSNAFGLGKFNLKMKKGETYTAKYKINNKEHKKNLPLSEALGFALNVNNYTNPKIAYINLKTNKETLVKEANKTYYLVINQTNKSSIIDLDINKIDEDYIIPIKSDNLLSGINTVTLFNDQLNPISERLIFNYTDDAFFDANIEIVNEVNDSLNININTFSSNKTPLKSNLSIAVLPKESVSYNTKQSIIGSFLIKPYIKGNIQNPDYYFTNIDRLKKYDLDLLLLTQGWSKYKWNDIKNSKPNLVFPFDKGVSIKGTLNQEMDTNENYTVQMYSFTNSLNETTTIDENKSFYFNNYYLKDSATVNFEIYKNDKKFANPKLYVTLLDNKRDLLKQIFESPKSCLVNIPEISNVTALNNFYFNEGQVLDTVNLFSKKKIKEKKLINKDAYIGNAYGKGIKIDSMQQRIYPYVVDIISGNGFNATQNQGFVSITNRRAISLNSGTSPLLIIDGVSMGTEYDIIYNMRLDEVDEIYFNRSGLGYGSRGGAGVISIYRKKGGFIGKDKRFNKSLLITNGFSTEKEFYIPLFYLQSKNDFIKYGAIDWKSEIITNNNGKASFKIKSTSIKEMIAIIQGFTIDGKLISKIQDLKFNSNQ